MAAFGMSAKDRLALFQKKAGTDDTPKTTPGHKKVGKIASKKEAHSQGERIPKIALKKAEGPIKKESTIVKKAQKVMENKKESLNDKPSDLKEDKLPILKETTVQDSLKVVKETQSNDAKGTVSVSAPDETETKLTPQFDTDLDLDSELEANMVSDSETSKQKMASKKAICDSQKQIAVEQVGIATTEVEQKGSVSSAERKSQTDKKTANVTTNEPTVITENVTKPDVDMSLGTMVDGRDSSKDMQDNFANLSTNVTDTEKAMNKEESGTLGDTKTQIIPNSVQDEREGKLDERKKQIGKGKTDKTPETAGTKEMPMANVQSSMVNDSTKEKTQHECLSNKQDAVPLAEKTKSEVTTVKPMQIFRPSGEDFYSTIFYFSGMGTVVGSSLSKGIFVPDRLTKTSLDLDVVEQLESYKPVEQKRRETVVESARNQAVDLSEELRKLRALLFGLPSWGDTTPLPVQDEQPQQWKNQGVDLISQANAVMVQALPKESTLPEVSAKLDGVVQTTTPPHNYSTSMYGVFPGDVEKQPSRGPWQERYGIKENTVSVPSSFASTNVEMDSKGLKSWQVSRLRGMEAKGIEFRRPTPKTGADYGGDVFSGGRKEDEVPHDDILSYAPFLVSNKTKTVDRKCLFTEHPLPNSVFKPIPPTGNNPLPYCDL